MRLKRYFLTRAGWLDTELNLKICHLALRIGYFRCNVKVATCQKCSNRLRSIWYFEEKVLNVNKAGFDVEWTFAVDTIVSQSGIVETLGWIKGFGKESLN